MAKNQALAVKQRDIILQAMDRLEQMPQGGIGREGYTMAEIEEAENDGRCVDDDACYHAAQAAWRLLDQLLE